MTDGTAAHMERDVKVVTGLNNRAKPKATIHTIGMISSEGAKKMLGKLAKQNGGQFRAVGK